MNNPTSTKKSSKPSKSDRTESTRKRIKAPVEDRVEGQLARRKESGETENSINYHGSSLESDPCETGSVKKVVWLPVESDADELASEANGKIMGKLRRAFRKAGKLEASETEIRAFLTSLLEAKVPVLNRSSGRIARVVKGEKSIESLLLARVSTKSA